MIYFKDKNSLYSTVGSCQSSYDNFANKVRETIAAIKTDKVALGYALNLLYESNAYRCRAKDRDMDRIGAGDTSSNCSSRVFFGACELDFNLDKSQVSRLMNVVDEFGDGKGDLIDYYKPFCWSVLVEMLPLTYEQRKKIAFDWTVKKVKEYKKMLVATSQQIEKDNDIDFDTLDTIISEEPEEKYAKCKPSEMRALLRVRDAEIERLKKENETLRNGEELKKLRDEAAYYISLAISNMADDTAAD